MGPPAARDRRSGFAGWTALPCADASGGAGTDADAASADAAADHQPARPTVTDRRHACGAPDRPDPALRIPVCIPGGPGIIGKGSATVMIDKLPPRASVT